MPKYAVVRRLKEDTEGVDKPLVCFIEKGQKDGEWRHWTSRHRTAVKQATELNVTHGHTYEYSVEKMSSLEFLVKLGYKLANQQHIKPEKQLIVAKVVLTEPSSMDGESRETTEVDVGKIEQAIAGN